MILGKLQSMQPGASRLELRSDANWHERVPGKFASISVRSWLIQLAAEKAIVQR
jgi:hypothetical protein